MATDVGIGEKFITKREAIPLPKARADILRIVKAELDRGGVRKLVLEVDEPIRIMRAVASDSVEAQFLTELPDEDLADQVRNAVLEQVPTRSDKEKAMLEAFEAFDLLNKRNARPKAFLARNLGVIRRWLSLDPKHDVSRLFGLPVKTSSTIDNDDQVILVGTGEDPDEVVMSVMIFVN